MKKREAVITGFSDTHKLRNANTFYCQHPELHTAGIDVVFPESEDFNYFAGWQAQHKEMYTNPPEAATLTDLLELYHEPKNVVDLACGVGRASVWLCKCFGWTNTEYWLCDSTADDPAWGVDKKSGYYNDLDITGDFFDLNCPAVLRMLVDTTAEDGFDLPDQIDLVVSFLAFGFHWPFNPYLEALEPYVVPGGLACFGTRGYDQGASGNGPGGIKARRFTECQIAAINPCWEIIRDARMPEARKSSMLVLRKK